jgi:hypothetical protein
MPGKSSIFTLLSILFRPRHKAAKPAALWWRRRVPPPGPISLLHRPFITIAGRSQQSLYKSCLAELKEWIDLELMLGNVSRVSREPSPHASASLCDVFIVREVAMPRIEPSNQGIFR